MRHRSVLLALGFALLVAAVVPTVAPTSVSATTPSPPGISIDQIWTDFDGFWDSGDAENPSKIKPNDAHHLLAFRLDDKTYSTGVDDAALTAEDVEFTAGSWRALPVEGLPTTGGGFYLYFRGSELDRSEVVGSSSGEFTSEDLSKQLTRGKRGLDLASGLANIPSSPTITFNLPSIVTGAIGDGVPDILITQMAMPAALQDTFKFVNESGDPVGDPVSINQNAIAAIGAEWGTQWWTIPKAGTSSVGGVVNPIRILALELSEFGITGANAADVARLEWTPSNTSDPAFFAYNTDSMTALAASVTSSVTPTVTLAPIADRLLADGPVATVATSSAGLTLTYATSDTDVCTVDGSGEVTPVSEGTCTVVASTEEQTISPTQYAAASATRSFAVLTVAPIPDPPAVVDPTSVTPTPQPASPGPVPPALAPAEGRLQLQDGAVVPLTASTPTPGVVRYVAGDLEFTFRGTATTGADAGLVADAGGTVECTVCRPLAEGSVIEAWLFSTPRLVAAWRVDDAPCQRFTLPLGAPLDGDGMVAPGMHTLQLVLTTSGGVETVDVSVRVEGPVPTGVPSGDGVSWGPAGGRAAGALVLLLGVAVAAMTARTTARTPLRDRRTRAESLAPS